MPPCNPRRHRAPTAWWDDEFEPDGVRALAVFASSADALFRAVPLTEPAGDSIHIGPSLHLTPLLGVLRDEGALVAFVTRERGTIYRFQDGRLHEIDDEWDDQLLVPLR